MASHPVGKRLPISCEPCRKRKIKCPRDSRPCQSCLRRGLRAEDCIYLGQPRLSQERVSLTDASVQRELLDRIRNLEDLLQKQIGTQPSPQNSDPVSTPITTNSLSGSDRESDIIGTESRSHLPGNFGSLQVSPSSHVRYVPLSSQWNSVLSKTPAGSHVEELEESGILDDEDLGFPFSGYGVSSKAELLSLLPPGRYCDELKDIYFRVFSPLFHILHDPTFEEEYQKFRRDANNVPMGWIALLFIILGIAVTALDDNDPLLLDLGHEKTISGNIRVLSSRYRSAALRCLSADGIVSRHSIRSLQALVLILYARIHRTLPSWTLLGFTHHMAIAMGCHIDPERFGLSLLECEERRRAWAGLMMIFTIQNTAFGCFGQRLLVQDTKPPADINDVDLVAGTYPERKAGPTQMTYLLLKFRLYEVSAGICQALFSFSNKAQPTLAQLENDIMTIHNTCNSRYLSDTTREPLPSHHAANFNILYSYIHQLCLLIHRPNFNRYFQGDYSEETRNSRDRCVESAKGSLAVYRDLFETPQFTPYKWYNSGLGSFHAFHAAVVLAVVLMNPDSQSEYDEIECLLVGSLDVFAALSHRSTVCTKAVTILRNLLDVASAHRRNAEVANTQLSLPLNPSAAYSPSEPPAISRQMEMMFAQLQPQYWLSPSAIAWDSWGFLTGEQLDILQPMPS